MIAFMCLYRQDLHPSGITAIVQHSIDAYIMPIYEALSTFFMFIYNNSATIVRIQNSNYDNLLMCMYPERQDNKKKHMTKL